MSSFRILSFALGILICLLCRPVTAEELVDFSNDIIPLLTKHGCNAGACHGAAIGRGGFKLSLYGGDPNSDYDAIVRQVSGRRVNLSKPDQSLIVLKPAEQLEHGGGMVFDDDSQTARLLTNWITQGVDAAPQRQLEYVEVMPAKHIAREVAQPIDLRAMAYYTDGSTRDVTAWTVFTAEDSTAVQITSEPIQSVAKVTATVMRRGRHIVVARYLHQVIPIELIVPLTDRRVDLSGLARGDVIDTEILASLATLGLEPSPQIDDASFLRRVSLDLTGRLPSAEVVDSFLQNNDPDKRTQKIDELLRSEAFTEYWTLQLAKLLRVRPQPGDSQGMLTYHHWLADQVRGDGSYKELARSLILAVGDSHEHGPANFYRTVDGPREQAEFVSELFMGSRLRCANCHNHPLDRWTQDDYHGLAAIFAKIQRGRTISVKATGQTIHPHTGEPAPERIPGESLAIDEGLDGRMQLVDWLTDPENPYFAKAIVNRLWKHMMGRGLVEPVDDFRDTNPATHPELLNNLAEDFVAGGYRFRHTLKIIASSDAYARSANATDQNKDDDRFYSHALRRALEPEVLADAISDVLGVADTYGEEPEGARAVALINPQTKSKTLDILGRCGREESCEVSQAAVGGLSQKLHLFNGALLNARIAAPGSRLSKHLDVDTPPQGIIEEFYVVALGRRPAEAELEHWKHGWKSAENTEAFLEDFVWGLLTSRDFVTNH